MLKVLIIDDEPNVRQGLKLILSWEENGFTICDEAGDPDEGLKKIIDIKPDIVLMDIKMSGKLGTEVIKEAIEAGYKGKFIVISGYSNFEYAKDAIKYGVKSYILKPIDEDELLEVLLNLKKEIISSKQFESNIKIIEEVRLQKLILDGEIEGLENMYLGTKNFHVALIYTNKYSIKEDEILKFENVIKKELSIHKDKLKVLTVNNYAAILFNDFKHERIIKIFENLKSKIGKELSEDIFIAIGEEVNSLNLINKSYKTAEAIMNNKFLYLDKGIICYESIKDNNFENTNSNESEYDKIASYVEVNDIEMLKKSIYNMEDDMRKNIYTENEIKIKFIKLFLQLKDKLVSDYELNEKDLQSDEQFMKEIHSKTSLKAVTLYLISKFSEISILIGYKASDNIVKRLISYININYYKNLRLETLAELFSYNSAYLGKLFKSEVGESFNTYLDKVRIEKAKVLLADEKLKVYKVCERVGYNNLDYFYSKFKKYVGVSPLNYKKQNSKAE